MEALFTIIIYFGFSFLVAKSLGSKRKIGFGWSLFFCLLLSPFIGLIITLLSRKYY